jgi:hypothetical protein
MDGLLMFISAQAKLVKNKINEANQLRSRLLSAEYNL